MKTEDLIRQLAGEETAQPVVAPMWRTLAPPSLLGFLCAAVVTAVVLGIRADLASAQAAVMSKLLVLTTLLVAVFPLVNQLSRPNTNVRYQLRLAATPFALSALAAIVSVYGQPPEVRMAAWIGNTIPSCLYLIPLVALPGTLSLMWFVRLRQAPTRLAFAGAAIGAFAAGIAGMVYALHCTIDEPAYILSWYPAAVLISAGLGAIAGRWMLRW
jgi:hypothetical protein